MFGYGHAKTLKKQNKKMQGEMNQMRSDFASSQINPEKSKAQVNQEAEESKALRRKAEEEGQARDEAFFGKNIQGLTPEQKSAMQYEANSQIKRNVQGLNRRLLGEQGMHGRRGGVAYAQQRDLAKMGQEAAGQSERGIQQLNADLALKKLAAIYAGGKGEAAQSLMERQRAEDKEELEREKRRQQPYLNQYSALFSRL